MVNKRKKVCFGHCGVERNGMKEYQERGKSFVVINVAQKKVILDSNIY